MQGGSMQSHDNSSASFTPAGIYQQVYTPHSSIYGGNQGNFKHTLKYSNLKD